ncbi:tyrosine-protein kinase SRK3-like [Liolophura sinensis]|uniref:tyrosine-protein kinase SRK3-like n=1 Tax=Liolophura sinensis TaxID=3198878 RepID=UPI003157F660
MAKSSCGSGGLGGGLKEKLQEEFLSCKICLEPFSRPKALPCLHTFCEHCLTDYVRRNPGDKAGWFPCPMCRKDTPIPPGGVPEFQDNFVLLSLSQTLDEDTNWVPPAVQHQSQVTPPRPICPPSPKEKKLRSFKWYFGKVSRNASEEWLLQPDFPKGTFLIRQGEATPDTYTLSVRDCDELRGFLVKHYKIHMKKSSNNDDLDSNNGDDNDAELKEYYYITTRRPFATLADLVIHYSELADGLCCKLTQICPKPRSLLWAMDRGKTDQWESPRERIRFVMKLGSGQFADVWLGKWNDSKDVAIKMQRPGSVSTAAFLDEAQILKTLQHNNIVRLLAVCTEQEPVYLVLEYMPRGRLSQYLREGAGKDLGLSELLWITTQIADGMAYMEREGFVHRNLGARNILVGENNNVRISGFGMTKVVDDPDFNFRKGLKMAIKWMAPEVLLYNKYSTKSDVWSFAVVMIEILSYGKEPYEGLPSKQAFEKIQAGYRMPRPELCPPAVYEVILTCWNITAPSRPSFDFLHTFLQDAHSS